MAQQQVDPYAQDYAVTAANNAYNTYNPSMPTPGVLSPSAMMAMTGTPGYDSMYPQSTTTGQSMMSGGGSNVGRGGSAPSCMMMMGVQAMASSQPPATPGGFLVSDGDEVTLKQS